MKQIKKLYDLGFAIHWVKEKSKAPLESKWTTGPRASWDYLEKTHHEGLNVGVRLGEASKIGNNYLACIDVDVKDPAFENKALMSLENLVDTGRMFPIVASGSGNGSMHLYCVTREPFKMFIHDKIKDAFEIAVYSTGRQMVLPPSVHPVTNEKYLWAQCRPTRVADFPLMEFSRPPEGEKKKSVSELTRPAKATNGDFHFLPVPVDIDKLKLSDDVRSAIVSGGGVKDRSGYLLRAAHALFSAGLDQNEVLSVLTDRDTFLGECAYEHAKTSERSRAAYWVWKYTVARVTEERNPMNVFGEYKALPKLTGEALKKQTDSLEVVKGWEKHLERTKDFAVRNTMKNIKLILREVFGPTCVKLNDFANCEEIHGAFPWNDRPGRELYDSDVTMIKDWIAHEWGFEPSDDKIRSALTAIAVENRYHPVKRWLRALPRWDEVERVDGLLSKYIPCAGDEELRAVVGRRFMVSLIQRIFKPGCQSDYLMVLEGLQGIQKSSAFRALVGDEWFSDATFNVEDKDAVMVIFSKWLIEFGELSTLDRTTAEHTKAFITRRMDRIRAPFERKARDYPRQCLFVGSTNKDQYLKDDTGNRRFWPFQVVSNCRVDLIAKDREQLFAEALYLYEAGEVTYLKEPHLEEKMRDQQAPREMHDLLTEQVANVIHSLEKQSGKELREFQMLDLFSTGKLNGVKLDQYGTARLGSTLRKLGFEKRRHTKRGDRPWFWFKIQPKEEMNGAHAASESAPKGVVSFSARDFEDCDFH